MIRGVFQWFSIFVLRCLPRNLMSRVAGWIAGWRFPQPLQKLQIVSFGKTFGVNFAEVKEPLNSFPSVQDFFVRELIDGARPVDQDASAFVSPCDGAWGESGIVENGQILQVKGRPYGISALIGNEAEAAAFEGGQYATFYLSPKDYHRYHAPCEGWVQQARYMPGSLWPVNQAGVRWVDGLFAENERIVASVCTTEEHGEVDLILIPVGATMVGKVKLTFDDLETNLGQKEIIERSYEASTHHLAKGQEWGRFEFGSTIVMLAKPGRVDLDRQPPGTPLVLGRRIGTMSSGSAQ